MEGKLAQDAVVPFSPPLVGEEEIDNVVDTLRTSWMTTGPKTKEFEDQFQRCLGAPAALAVNSCTAALHLALKVLGIGPGDEVITTTLTFASTVNVIEHVGARPVLVDVEPDTLNLDPVCVERAITSRTKAILVVHFAGHPVEMDSLAEIAHKYGLEIVEDAAHALPAAYKNINVGSRQNLTAFSFYATKNLTTGEGGMLTGPVETLERARSLSLHGMSRDAWNRYGTGGHWFYDIVSPGFKCNMMDIQAAIGLAQLSRLGAMQATRETYFAEYNRAFGGMTELTIPTSRPEVAHARHLYVLRLNQEGCPLNRDELIETLKRRGIGTSVHFIPIHLHSYYRDRYGYQPTDYPVAFANFQRMLSLPLSPALTIDQIRAVIVAVTEAVTIQGRMAG